MWLNFFVWANRKWTNIINCKGLPEGDVFVGDIHEDLVSKSLVCAYIDRKSSKFEWKFDDYTALDEQSSSRALYQRVYGRVRR